MGEQGERRANGWGSGPLLVCVSLVALVACGTSSLVEVPAEIQRADEVVESGWSPAVPGANLQGDTLPVWFRLHPPPMPSIEDPAIKMNRGWIDEVYVDGRRIGTIGHPMIVPLGPASKTVLVRSRVVHSYYVPRFKAGSQRALWAETAELELPDLAIGGTMLIAGLMLLGASLRRGGSRANRGLGLFLASVATVVLLNLHQLVQFLHLPYSVFRTSHDIATSLYPIGFAEFVLGTFGDGRFRIVRRGLRAYALFLALGWTLDLTGIYAMNETRDYIAFFIIAFALQGIVLAARQARRGDSAGWAFLVGISLLLLFGAFDLWPSARTRQMVPFGLLGFGAAMALVLERRFTQARDAAETSARELALQVTALEQRNQEVEHLNRELRHQVVERSKQLVHVLHTGAGPLSDGRPLAPDDVIGDRYRVIQPLGQGGMGAVYQVERVTDKRQFALKVMCGQSTPSSAARFAREAEIAARIAHPNLVSVVDVGGAETGELYFVMELVQGRSLEEARDRFGDVPWCLRLLGPMADGLAALHDAGVVHRDLKPGNVLIAEGPDGSETVKIADFGISHLESAPLIERPSGVPALRAPTPAFDANAETVVAGKERVVAPTTLAVESPDADGRPSGPQLTATGMIMGTPAYMAPEVVANARAARPASDVFALGLIAYEMFVGRPAFDVPPGMLALAGKPLPEVRTDLLLPHYPSLARLIIACMSMDPDARPSARDVAAEVRRAAESR